MKIGTKIISWLALLFLALICLEILVERQVVMPSFAELEREDARTSMKRIDYALNATLDSIALSAADWGNWADVYHFVEMPAPEFERVNVTQVALKQLQVNTLMIVDRSGRVVLSSSRDLDTGAALDIDFAALRNLPADFPWLHTVIGGAPAQGLLRTDAGILMLAAAPVLDGSGSGEALGMVVMGRILGPHQVKALGAQAQATLAMLGDPGSAAFQEVVETEKVTQVYRRFEDLFGHPLMSLRVEVPRKITARGQSAVSYASACLIGAGAAALVLVVIILNRIVLEPLARVTRHALGLGEGTDLSARLDMVGSDEVAVMAREFDGMVARLAASRRQLVDQSFQAGFAELAKGVLHNLGNAMTPLGVRLTQLADGLRDAPMNDLELAVTELAGETSPSARHDDLMQFLLLGCRQLSATLGEARADVAVIQRQTAIVQTALAELMRSTRNEHVVEAVRLPDLVQQTLDIVPDACRQRLRIETDDSLRRVGVVQVARTVLRLVLQNLIINAADAVRDAGRERGVLRVAAEIVHEADGDRLHLRCEDDGIGIAEADLERVFDQGYSTKSRDTNHGIGLHWSANAVSALGGRLWAASPGRGHGASIHLMIPL